jgi:eukaryotic-like serine/threonine-protein kinase
VHNTPRRTILCLPWLILALAVALSCAAADDWPMLRGDTRRSGLAGPVAETDMAVAWATKLGSSVDSSPAVVAGRVYVGTAEGSVFCLNAADGEVIWETPTDGCVVSSPAVHDGFVYVGSVDRCLYALAAATGEKLWRVRTWRPVVASPLILDGRVYIGSMDGSFKCVEAATGELIWEEEGGPVSGSAAGDEGVVFYGDEAGNIRARQANTGKEIWSATVTGSIIRAPLVAADLVIFGVMSPTALRAPKINYIIAFDRTTGKQRWALEGQSSLLHTAVADADSIYYATVSGYTSTTKLFAARLSDGKEKWKVNLAGVADCSPALAGNHLLFGNHDCNFHIVNTANGHEVQSIPIGAKLYSSPAVADGRIYFGAGDGKLYCLK